MIRLRGRIRVAKRLSARHGILAALVDRDLASRAPNAFSSAGWPRAPWRRSCWLKLRY